MVKTLIAACLILAVVAIGSWQSYAGVERVAVKYYELCGFLISAPEAQIPAGYCMELVE